MQRRIFARSTDGGFMNAMETAAYGIENEFWEFYLKKPKGSATVLTLVNNRFQNHFGIPFFVDGVPSGASPRTPEIFLASRVVFNVFL